MIRTRHLLLKLFLAALVPAALVLIYLDAKITSTFTDKMWELPAKVYARPLELFAGARLKAEDLAYELEVLGYRSVANPGGPGQFARNRDRFEIYTRGFDFPGENEPARAGYEQVFATIKLDVRFEIHEVEEAGDYAWARTSSAGRTKILAAGVQVAEGNNELFIFRRENGAWKIHRYLFATTQPRT